MLFFLNLPIEVKPSLELNELQLFDVYMKEIRSILEMAVPAWHLKMQSKEIENVQKLALKIIV